MSEISSVMRKKPSELYMASLSDVHLGHPKTPTSSILRNLRKAFPDTEETGKLDLIFIVGDLFDRLLSVPDPAVIEIKTWFHQFLRMCAKRDIVVRVLEGTPSHDWKQSWLMDSINQQAEYGVDLKYVTTLSIEYLERFGINILYVPDEWLPETDDTWKEVVQLLRQRNLEKVDYALIHGSFTYQLPPAVSAPTHDPERYLGIVSKYIFVGHVHKSSVYERILAHGSFDRLSHGEEEAKGHWRVKATPERDHVTFIETKDATKYVTVNCVGIQVEDALERLKVVANLPDGSHVRVMASKTDPIMASLDVLRVEYPTIHWTSKAVETETKSVQANLLVDLRSSFQQLNITPDNLPELIMRRLEESVTDQRLLERCRQRLTEIVQ